MTFLGLRLEQNLNTIVSPFEMVLEQHWQLLYCNEPLPAGAINITQYLVQHFGSAFAAARQSSGFSPDQHGQKNTPLQTIAGGQALSLGDQLPVFGRMQTTLMSLFAACRIYAAQLGIGAQGPSRKEAFMALIGASADLKAGLNLEVDNMCLRIHSKPQGKIFLLYLSIFD